MTAVIMNLIKYLYPLNIYDNDDNFSLQEKKNYSRMIYSRIILL